jgi:hypothetical protein
VAGGEQIFLPDADVCLKTLEFSGGYHEPPLAPLYE